MRQRAWMPETYEDIPLHLDKPTGETMQVVFRVHWDKLVDLLGDGPDMRADTKADKERLTELARQRGIVANQYIELILK